MGKKHKRATLVIQDSYVDLFFSKQYNNEEISLKELIEKYKQECDKKNQDHILCNQILPKFEKLIFKIISKYSTFDKEDLKQVAHLAIIKALKNYQEMGLDPTSYFISYIEKEIKSYVMNSDIIKIPKTIRKLYYQIQKYISLNPGCTISEISDKFNLTEEAIKEILSIPQKNNIEISFIKSKEHRDLTLPIEDKIFLEQIIYSLTEIEKKVMKFLFYEDITKVNLAQKLNISRKHLYTILDNIKQKMLKKIF
ncbi:MAG: sigma-70 family RNA polymerase sigma factor [Candidatus Calescibacterium sp.]|nr:sigma-70 family RNA polymerase sigma factor [Candidatus Calescibacterium sp.]MDW8132801.1 sigma-70 family RNA polymerase sigma factor [Candidatus Calescibacterium sp.]